METHQLYLEDKKDLPKLFCTFTDPVLIETTLTEIQNRYTILFSKIFVLSLCNSEEIILTYNIDQNNLQDNTIMDKTILVHRKKISNTLYTINSLNVLIASLNNGNIDHNFQINWQDYKNSMLITREGEFIKINTTLLEIINLN